MAHINLYQAFGLDQGASSGQLWQALTDRLDGASPAAQHEIETARAILSDSNLRSQYDARLADPSAPQLDATALDQLSGLWGMPVAAPTAAGAGVLSIPILATIASVLVIAVAVVTAVVISSDSTDPPTPPAPVAQSDTSGAQPAPAEPSTSAEGAPAPAQQPSAPVDGAYPGAGGPRPVEAIPLPTYTKGGVTHAHLLTPTGGIGCDFSTQNEYTRQGQCGVRSMNTTNSPLGTERIGSSVKGKWLFPFSNNRVGAPHGSSGTTGWMNQPMNDGYQVPRVEYGKQYYFENWAIASQENGLTVWNTTTGSGVFLSNEKAETFDGPGTTGASPNADDEIVLGSLPSNGKGYGTARPSLVHNGGGPTTGVKDITWSSWGGPTAEGNGTGTWQSAGLGSEEYVPAVIVASKIGTCNGKRAYTRITWYLPTKGEKLGDRLLMDACWS